MRRSFLVPVKDNNPPNQEAFWAPGRKNKSLNRHIILKL